MTRVHRFEIRPTELAGDVHAASIAREAAAIGLGPVAVATARVYLIEAPLTGDHLDRVETGLLCDGLTESATRGASRSPADGCMIEVLPKPGVMDPVAQSVADAVRELTGLEPRVATGWRYDFAQLDETRAAECARRLLANPVIHDIHAEPAQPDHLPTGTPTEFRPRTIPIRDLDDDGLARLSREGHLFLDLHEMQAIRGEYRELGREPTDIELETLAQTWSEHCVHKTLKSTIRYTPAHPDAPDPIDWSGRPGHTVNADGSITIDNLLKSTVAAATHELIAGGIDWALSVFEDNAGVVAFDDDHAVCIKVETHNHPSAIEPYGGAATGIGGCIRDIIGTGLAARPIANTDVFCVAPLELQEIPSGCLPPRRVLEQVVAGVRDYGNRMGIPTVNGAVDFDDRYVGNPLVYCGCVGLIPRDRIFGSARAGDLIVAIGGRTGRDGIHGATFSSAELTDSHADEFSHAVQIGNAIEEKRVLDAILLARDTDPAGPLFSAITDCGAGGFSSAVGEMGEKIGAEVHLDRAPLKYEGLTYTEIWISEAQERMVLAVPRDNLDRLRAICDGERVEMCVLGTFGTPGRDLILHYHGHEVGRLPMEFLHDGIPTPTRSARWEPPTPTARPARAASGSDRPSQREALLGLLAHPAIASKHTIIRQYDHEVQGNTVVKPLMGPGGLGPSDAAVIEPVPGSGRGVAIACGLQTRIGDPRLGGDPYLMALAAIDECVRNLVCAGADPDRIAILDNFCWPSCGKEQNLASLVRAAEGCYDGAKAYRTPFVSGKDSLNNQFTIPASEGTTGRTIEIPPTLLITGLGIVPSLDRCTTSDAKHAGSRLVLLAPTGSPGTLTNSVYASLFGSVDRDTTVTDLVRGPAAARTVAEAISRGLAAAAHDVSEGGLLVALAEMLIGSGDGHRGLGAVLDAASLGDDLERALFAEPASRYLLEARSQRHADEISKIAERHGLGAGVIGTFNDTGTLTLSSGPVSWSVAELTEAWRGTLNW
ncbi:MAG: phosphoribosylformylglycinamidine synthase subunit PurS [Phycisphaerales bacterium JB037]